MLMMVVGGSGGIGTELEAEYKSSPEYTIVPYSSRELDITKLSDVVDCCRVIQPDIILNLAGISHDSFLHKWNTTTISNVDQMIDVNVKGAVNLLAGCLPIMRKNKFGRIIMMSSVLVNRQMMGTGVYSATKAFVDSLVKTASAENISHGITCNSIQLGYFDAGMAHRIPEDIAEGIKHSIPLKRWGSMKELKNTIDYLVKTEYITGQNIEISGGLP